MVASQAVIGVGCISGAVGDVLGLANTAAGIGIVASGTNLALGKESFAGLAVLIFDRCTGARLNVIEGFTLVAGGRVGFRSDEHVAVAVDAGVVEDNHII